MKAIIEPEQFKTYTWSGGKSTEMYVYPKGKNFKDKDFSFRVSTSTFSDLKSEFTDYTGFHRFILPIKGELTINNKEFPNHKLETWMNCDFDGGLETTAEASVGCKDFNFIVSNKDRGDLMVIEHDISLDKDSKDAYFICFATHDYHLRTIYEDLDLKANTLFITNEVVEITILDYFPVIVCEWVPSKGRPADEGRGYKVKRK